MKHYEVVAAIIIHQDKILCVQRGPSKYEYISHKFEFPGGKIEPNETPQNALSREILEELNMQIDVGQFFLTVDHQYPDFRITMHSFLCKASSPEIHLSEHVSFQWLTKDKLENLDWAAADVPIVNQLLQ
jgi:8-oxo-dGTP diphosphatase